MLDALNNPIDFVNKLSKTHNNIFSKYAKCFYNLYRRKFNFMLFSAHLDLVRLRNKIFGKKLRYHLISKYFIFIFAKTYCHLHKKFLLCHPISFDQGFAIANTAFEIIIHVRPGILMLYLPTRWETNIGKGNKNMTLIWQAITTAKTQLQTY